MQRIGSGDAAEPTSSRPTPRHTDPMVATVVNGTPAVNPRRQTSRYNLPEPAEQDARPEPASWQRSAARSPEEDAAHWATRMRTEEFERTTEPNAIPIRVPALNPREWLFIALLACASAATLYSLLIDDVTPSVEEDTDAATTIEHVVTPAEPAAEKAAPKPSVASATSITEIASDPPHAEVVLGGAVIGNTPTQVVRGQKDADYLLRKQGYESQLVRVTAHSGPSISITLRAKQPQ
jgi:hypothetical protein